MNLIHTIHEPGGAGPHPTILTLHGRGTNALDLLGLAPLVCSGKFLMICPQGPLAPIGTRRLRLCLVPHEHGRPAGYRRHPLISRCCNNSLMCA